MHKNPLASLFGPPFKGLWLIALVYYALSFIFCGHSQVLKGNLPDADDYMYLTQILDWLGGQGWYDNIQHRLNPPEGVMIHFSRLTMIPMAAFTLLFKHTGMNLRNSALMMAMIYPLLLLGGFFAALRWTAESFMLKDWAGLTAVLAIFCLSIDVMFQPGHIDHHGLIVLLAALALGCAVRMIDKPGDIFQGIAAGTLLAIGMTVALETLPWVLLIAAYLGLWAAMTGNGARNVIAFGSSLFLVSVLGLLTFRPPHEFFTISLLTYSVVYVLLTGGIAVSLTGTAAANKLTTPLRLCIGTGLAAATGVLFFYRFPDLVAGPYGAMDPQLAKVLLGDVSEARPMIEKAGSWLSLCMHVLYHLTGTLIATGAGLYFFWKAQGRDRWKWGLLLVLLIAALLLTSFYQSRFAGVMEMLAIIPLTTLLQSGCEGLQNYRTGQKALLAKTALLLLVVPLPLVILPYIMDSRGFANGIFFFPARSVEENVCDMHGLTQVLNDPSFLGDRPQLLLNNMDLGPELLFRTSHQVLAAPFLDISGDVDAYHFFSTTDPEEARSIAEHRHIKLVVSCLMVPASYSNETPRPFAIGVAHEFAPHFIDIIGDTPPEWLTPFYLPQLRNFVVYGVRLPNAR